MAEEAKNKPTAFSEANVDGPTSSVLSNHLTYKNYQSKFPIDPAVKYYIAKR